MSNPAPSYVENVSYAFKTGIFTFDGISFGSNKYGDMEATVAAIYLDSAARDVVLDVDVTSGSLREPLLKVIALMKSMEFLSKTPVTVLQDLIIDIGQMAHEFKSVFSFFLPEFKPYGRVGGSSLVSPEATLLDMPKMIGLLNGLTSLVKFGLSSCDGGWGNEYCRENVFDNSPNGMLGFNKTVDEDFSYETFEGPSLIGGLDQTWVGRYFDHHNGKVSLDPLADNNHVLHFPEASWNSEFYSIPIKNEDVEGNSYAVKFRFLSMNPSARGCIGYVDASRTSLNTQTWVLCESDLESDGNWISCQFLIPPEIESFRIAIGDRASVGGDAYFDDFQLASGNETTCKGIEIMYKDPPGVVGYSNEVVDRLSTLLTAGRLQNEAKGIVVNAFDNAGSALDGVIMAQQLIVTSAEFHTTNIAKSTDKSRDEVSFPESSGKPYKAVVFLMLNGGCDSFNMLTPYTCSNGLYESYLGE